MLTQIAPIAAKSGGEEREMADADPMIRPISADSHIIEPPECFLDFIDPAFRERAPKLVTRESGRGDAYIVEGFPIELALNTLAAAGKKPEEIKAEGDSFSAIHRSSWDPSLRLADQDADGVGAEVIYPTIGMLICNVDDADYKNVTSIGFRPRSPAGALSSGRHSFRWPLARRRSRRGRSGSGRSTAAAAG